MLVLDALVLTGIFSVPKITGKTFKASTLFMQLATTCLSLYLTLKELTSESEALMENKLEYMLVCLKAKQNWIPFGNLIEKRRIYSDINFGELEFKKPGKGMMGSNSLGGYKPLGFQFSELTLTNFTRLINNSFIAKKHRTINEVPQEDL